MDFFRIDGRCGPNILRLDFLFHIYIVNIANCILIKKKAIVLFRARGQRHVRSFFHYKSKNYSTSRSAHLCESCFRELSKLYIKHVINYNIIPEQVDKNAH